ncbi:MAG: zinc-ribbon domain-containing protein [Aestuariivirgaceae bacterium]
MIISCPSCATRYDLPGNKIAADGSVIRCAECGHSWLESSAVEVIDARPEPALALPAPIADDNSYELEIEALRLTRASMAAERQHNQSRARKRAETKGWFALSAAIAAAFAGLYMFPQHVVKYAPGTARLYEKAEIPVNIRGFEIADIQQQHLLADGTRVLAVRGKVKNIAGSEEKAPALRFILRDAQKRQVYAWTLNGVATRALKPDEATSFVTRVASPPETADDLQIRFARADEIGSNAGP